MRLWDKDALIWFFYYSIEFNINDDHSYTVFTKPLISSIKIQDNINLQVLFITCHSSTFEFPTPNPDNNLVASLYIKYMHAMLHVISMHNTSLVHKYHPSIRLILHSNQKHKKHTHK